MLRLCRCEFRKLRRLRLLPFLCLAAVLFPAFGTLMAAQGNITPQEVYGNTIGMLVAFGLPFLLPVVVGLLATRLFYLEAECDTLKQLRTVPVRIGALTAAKLLVLTWFVFFVTFLAAGSCVLAGAALCGGYVETALPIWRTALLDGILQAAAALPLVWLVVLLRRSHLFSLLAALLYSVVNGFLSLNVLMQMSVLPPPLSTRPFLQQLVFWTPGGLITRCLFAAESGADGSYRFAPWQLAVVLMAIAGLFGLLTARAYARWER